MQKKLLGRKQESQTVELKRPRPAAKPYRNHIKAHADPDSNNTKNQNAAELLHTAKRTIVPISQAVKLLLPIN